ncbi:hypothetical protein D478_11532 [Brevibacillus agri BAB-2500]|nr:hypothetical protein D478_11532 [Brevibacillus agri BAB-2500]
MSPEYPKDSTYSLDLFGYKFENNQVKLPSVISINRENQGYNLEDLENITKRYNIKINKIANPRKSQNSFLSPNKAKAAGIDVNLPDSFSNIYTWETEMNNFIDINSTQQRLAKSYHVWEVYKDDTPSNPDTKAMSISVQTSRLVRLKFLNRENLWTDLMRIKQVISLQRGGFLMIPVFLVV